MSHWNRRLLFGAMAVLVPVLAGCEAGYDAPTLTFHPANGGTNVTRNGVTIDNAFVLGPPPGSVLPSGGQAAVFLAIEAANGDRLVSVSASKNASSVTVGGGSVDLPAQKLVNLGGPAPQVVLSGLTSPLSGGETVTLTFTFAQAGDITITVPVHPDAYDYATYYPPPAPEPSVTPVTTASPSATP